MNKLRERDGFWLFSGFSLLCVLAGGGLSVALGVDSNYDLKKYHVHNAWAALNGRLDVDFFSAGLQTYFNPLLDIPYYFLAVEWFNDCPKLVTFLMGVPAGLLFALTGYCVFTILGTVRGMAVPVRILWSFFALFLGLTSAPVIFQVGSLTNEIQTGMLVVAGIAVLLRWRKRVIFSALLAGALLGLAAGAKLTALLYTPPFLLALLIYRRGFRERACSFFAFSCAWWVLFLAAYGWWGFALWRATGSPFFPFFNNVFKSELLPALSFNDPWFRPTTWRETLFYPFYWVNTRAVSEAFCTDIRFALAQTCLGVGALFFILRRWRPAAPSVPFSVPLFREPRLVAFLFVFLISAFVFWEKQFSILRYTVPVAVFLGLLILLLLIWTLDAAGARLRDARARRGAIFLITSAIVSFCVVAGATTRYPHWGRLRGGAVVFDVSHLPRLPKKTLLFFAGPETQFLAPFFARQNPDVVFSSPADDPRFTLDYLRESELTQRIKAFVAGHDGPICVLTPFEYSDRLERLGEFGINIEPRLFQSFLTNYGGFRLYFATKTGEVAKQPVAGGGGTKSDSDSAAREFFVGKILTHFETRWTAEDRILFDAGNGWGRCEKDKPTGRPFRWTHGSRSTVEFFLRDGGSASLSTASLATPSLRVARTLLLRGRPFGKQRVAVSLNAREIFKGVAGENLEIPIPPDVLRSAAGGANFLEFRWPDAARYDNRPWPEGPRPGWGDQRVVAYAVEEIEIRSAPASAPAP